MALSLSKNQIEEQAERMDRAERERRQVKAPTNYYPNMSIEDAYHIQDAWISKKTASGLKIIGHKVGLTSKVMQKAMSISEPDFGVLLEDMYFENGAKIKTDDFLDPRIEVELAFQLKENLDPYGLSIEKLLAATDFIAPALELLAARSFRVDPETGYKRTVKDTISDNAANAGIILGAKHIPKTTDLRWIGALLRKNGTIEESGLAAAVLDHPANGVLWLAKKYASINRQLQAGQIILAGSFTRAIICKVGDKIEADFNTFGKVTCEFI